MNENDDQKSESSKEPVAEAVPASKRNSTAGYKRPQMRFDIMLIGLFLIGLGGLLLYSSFYPQVDLRHLIVNFWPLLLVAAGLIKIVQSFMGVSSRGSGFGWLIFAAILLFFASGIYWDVWDDDDVNIHFGPWGMNFAVESSSQSLDVTDEKRLQIDSNRSRIRIIGQSGDSINISQRIFIRGWGNKKLESDAKEFELDISRTDEAIILRSRPERFVTNESRIVVELEIRVPKDLMLVLNGKRSDILVKNVDSNVDITNQYGDIELIGLTNNVTIDCESGDLEFDDLEGGLNVRGRRLDIELEEIYGKITIDVERSGIELLNYRPIENDIDISTSRGSIEVELNHGSSFSLDAAAGSGKVYYDFGNTDVVERRKYSRTENEGTYLLRLKTSRGSVSIDES